MDMKSSASTEHPRGSKKNRRTNTEPKPKALTLQEERLYRIREVCEILAICRSKAYMLMNAGQLAYVRIPGGRDDRGGDPRIPASAIRHFRERNLIEKTA